MPDVQSLIDQFWIDKTRGLALGAACGELIATSTPAESVTSLPHADAVTAAAELLSRWRHHSYDETDLSGEGFAAAFTVAAAAVALPAGRASLLGVGALAMTIIEPTRLAQIARRCARVGGLDHHDHDAAAWHASAVALALAGEPYRPVATPHANQVLTQVAGGLYRRHLAALRALRATPDTAAATAVEHLGDGDTPAELALTATLTLLLHPDDLTRAVALATAIGGTPSAVHARAAMTGTLLGARLGAAGLPTRWSRSIPDAPARSAAADIATNRADLPLLLSRPAPQTGTRQ